MLDPVSRAGVLILGAGRSDANERSRRDVLCLHASMG